MKKQYEVEVVGLNLQQSLGSNVVTLECSNSHNFKDPDDYVNFHLKFFSGEKIPMKTSQKVKVTLEFVDE